MMQEVTKKRKIKITSTQLKPRQTQSIYIYRQNVRKVQSNMFSAHL